MADDQVSRANQAATRAAQRLTREWLARNRALTEQAQREIRRQSRDVATELSRASDRAGRQAGAEQARAINGQLAKQRAERARAINEHLAGPSADAARRVNRQVAQQRAQAARVLWDAARGPGQLEELVSEVTRTLRRADSAGFKRDQLEVLRGQSLRWLAAAGAASGTVRKDHPSGWVPEKSAPFRDEALSLLGALDVDADFELDLLIRANEEDLQSVRDYLVNGGSADAPEPAGTDPNSPTDVDATAAAVRELMQVTREQGRLTREAIGRSGGRDLYEHVMLIATLVSAIVAIVMLLAYYGVLPRPEQPATRDEAPQQESPASRPPPQQES